MADAVSLAVLDRLVGEILDALSRIPAPDRAAQRATPAAEVLDEPRELKQMRSGLANPKVKKILRGSPRV